MSDITKLQVPNSILTNNSDLIKVDCSNISWVNGDASFAFANFTNLVTVKNLGSDVTNIGGIFDNCVNLVEAPKIPASVVNTAYIDKELNLYGYDLPSPIFSYEYYEEFSQIYLKTDPAESEGDVFGKYNGSIVRLGNYYLQGSEGDTLYVELYLTYSSSTSTSITRNTEIDEQGEAPQSDWVVISAFNGCNSLVNAPVLEEGLTNIDYLFYNLPNLAYVNVPTSVQSMTNTFTNCVNLKSITLNTQVNDISEAFVNCYNLTTAAIIGSESVLDNSFQNCYNLTNVVLGENVTSLNWTFYHCNTLANITIPNSVTSLDYAFYDCEAFTTIPTIPNSISDLNGTFIGCSNLTNVNTLGDNIKGLNATFLSCANLTSITIPSSVVSLQRTFSSCHNLVEVRGDFSNISGSLNETFSDCNNLTTVPDIPNTVNSMFNTFNGCTNLVNLPNIPQGMNLGATFYGTGVNNVNKVFQTNPSTLWDTFSSCKNITSVEMDVPSSVTTMSGAFSSCTNLQYFNGQIPASVTGMQWAFQGCSNLKELPVVPSSVTSIFNAFKWCNSWNGTLYIDSTNISNAANAFFLTSVNATVNTRKVYIYFTYTNGQYTKTYNSLTKAGYNTSTRKHGVLLYNRGSHD